MRKTEIRTAVLTSWNRELMPDKLTLINYDIHAYSYCITDEVVQITERATEQAMTILELQDL